MKEFICGKYRFPLGKKTYIMGILNITPDSFSDGGKYNTVEKAVSHAKQMLIDGADIIDIGAASTRPFSNPVSPEEEWERLSGVLSVLLKDIKAPVSVDTYNASTAEKCLAAGVSIINDVSGIFSSEMAGLIKKYNAGWIVMHGGVKTGGAETEKEYEDGIVPSVKDFFACVKKQATDIGVPSERICFDPGFGFSKNTEQNSELLKNFDELKECASPLLCALSKKRFIGELSYSADTEHRLEGTLAANALAVIKGADFIRVHDIAEHKKFFSLIDSICR